MLDKSRKVDATLLVFCKQPRLHQGKQRIAATLGAEKALDIASGLLACALEDASQWEGPIVLSPAAENEKNWADSLLPHAHVLVQPEGNLGERIMAVDLSAREKTGEQKKIIIMGTDAPILNLDMFNQALDALDHSDVVFSSAEDGGVTLMGSNLPWPDIAELAWSTDRLGHELHTTCLQAKRTVSYIDPSYDIDLEKDLRKLLIDLESDTRPSRQALLSVIHQTLNHTAVEH